MYWVEGRLTRKQKTTRPDNCWPELWQCLTPKEKKEAQDEWQKIGPEREKHRRERGIWVVPEKDAQEYKKVLAHAIALHYKCPRLQLWKRRSFFYQ